MAKLFIIVKLLGIYVKDFHINKIKYKNGNNDIIIKTNYCISSMPIKDLFYCIKGIDIDKKIYNYAINLPYREFMSVCLVVNKLKLKNTTNIKTINNIVPDSWIYIQEPDVKVGRLQLFNNWSPYLFRNREDFKNKVLISMEYFCSEKDRLWKMNDEKFIAFAIQEAKKLNIIFDEKDVVSSKRIKILKAYPAYFGTYKYMNEIIDYINQFDNLYCIGRNGQHRYNNMDHSMFTGIIASKCILNNCDKNNVWNVNVEKQYHEVK